MAKRERESFIRGIPFLKRWELYNIGTRTLFYGKKGSAFEVSSLSSLYLSTYPYGSCYGNRPESCKIIDLMPERSIIFHGKTGIP